MGTRSIIRIKDQEDKSIYCHWDGYPSNNGYLLKKHFNKKRKVKQLIALGSLSALHKRLRPTKEHNFDSPQKNVAVAHHRDRGDPLSFNSADEAWVDYIYEWYKGHWYVQINGEFELLTDEIIKEY